MALEDADIIKIRQMILKEMLTVITNSATLLEARTKVMEGLRDAQADEIALTDPQAAEAHRRLKPEW